MGFALAPWTAGKISELPTLFTMMESPNFFKSVMGGVVMCVRFAATERQTAKTASSTEGGVTLLLCTTDQKTLATTHV